MNTSEKGFVAPEEKTELSLVLDSERPRDRSAELSSMAVEIRLLTETQSALENSLVVGFQTIVDTFGAQHVAETLSRHDMPTMTAVIGSLAPTADDRAALYKDMRGASLEKTFAEMNDKAGGSQNFDTLDQANRFRNAEVNDLEAGRPTSSTELLLEGFHLVAQEHPEIIESFKDSGDVTSLLGHIRAAQVEVHGDFIDARAEVLGNASAERQHAYGEIESAQDEIEAQYQEVIERIEASLESAQTQGNQYAVDSNTIALAHQQSSLEQNRARFNSSRVEADARLSEQTSSVDQLKVNQLLMPTPMTNAEGLILEIQDGKAVGRVHDSYAA